jgi:alpha-glucosidase
MKQFNILICILSMLILLSCKTLLQEDASISSPNGDLNVELFIKEGKAYYQIHHKDKLFMEPSELGYHLQDSIDLASHLEISDIIKSSYNQSWKPVWGENGKIRNEYTEMLVRMNQTDENGRKLNIYFRAFNDGIAFRYLIPHQSSLSDIVVLSEESNFNFTGDHKTWWIPANFDSYEFLYTKSVISEIEGVNTPVTFKINDSLYASIHEAHLEDYAGMTLKKSDNKIFGFESELVPWSDGTKVKGTIPFISPWRTVQISESAIGLIESNMILNLNPPQKIEHTDWIEPMKYMGIWWGMHIGYQTWTTGRRHGATTRNVKAMIDFAAENGIRGVLAEGWNSGWENWGQPEAFDQVTPASDFNLEDVTQYASEKGVAFIGHHETGGDAEYYEQQLDTAFALCARLGMKAVKTGYAGSIRPDGEHHHGQYMVKHYRKVLEKAAEYKLMIDVHEPIKPTGERRTYPNMMTREGVRGMEWNAWSSGNPPEHTTILPFTRALAGPIDYTPGIFDLLYTKHHKEMYDWNAKPKEGVRVHTTLAKQLALMVVLYSPMQMAADLPENYEDSISFQFIKDVPLTFDRSITLNGEIGDYITVARKKDDKWFIGSITDENQRELSIDLKFLKNDKNYTATIYADTDSTDWVNSPQNYSVFDTTLTSKDKWLIKLAKGGGQSIYLREKVYLD